MDRIVVVGCCGSGKSYVAREIGRLTGAPVTHLDAIYYDDEWNAAPMDGFADAQRELVARPRWVIDGPRGGAANSIQPTRRWRSGCAPATPFFLRRQPGPASGLLCGASGAMAGTDSAWMSYVLGYRRSMRPRVRAKFEKYAGHARVVSLRDRAHARQWLAELAELSDQQLREGLADLG
jgi:hypothetical protein